MINTNFICYDGQEPEGWKVQHTWDIRVNPHIIKVWRILPGDDRIRVATIFVPAYIDEVPGATRDVCPYNLVQAVSKAWMQGARFDPPATLVAQICEEDGYAI